MHYRRCSVCLCVMIDVRYCCFGRGRPLMSWVCRFSSFFKRNVGIFYIPRVFDTVVYACFSVESMTF